MKMFQQIITASSLALLISCSGNQAAEIISEQKAEPTLEELIVGDWEGQVVYWYQYDSISKSLKPPVENGTWLVDIRFTKDSLQQYYFPFTELKASKYLIEDDSIRFDIEKTESWDNQHIKISNDTLYLTHPNMVYGDVYTFTATRTTFDDNDILSLETDGINHRHLEYTWNIIQNNKPWIDSLDIKPPSTIRFSKDSIFVDDSPYLLSIDHKRLSILGQEFILLLEDEETVSLHPTKHLAKRWFLIYRRQGLGY